MDHTPSWGELLEKDFCSETPNWLPLTPRLHKSAKEILEDFRGHLFLCLNNLKRQGSGDTESLLSVIVPLLWGWDRIPKPWLRHLFSRNIQELQKIANTSELGSVHRCLDCEQPLEPRDRDCYIRRIDAIESILASGEWGFIPTMVLCDLLCGECLQLHLYSRQIRIEELRNMSYEAYLRTHEWQVFREQALQTAGYRCKGCMSPRSLNVHHLSYERIGDESVDDLSVFCRRCHQRLHNIHQEAS